MVCVLRHSASGSTGSGSQWVHIGADGPMMCASCLHLLCGRCGRQRPCGQQEQSRALHLSLGGGSCSRDPACVTDKKLGAGKDPTEGCKALGGWCSKAQLLSCW